jgi:uncharacterized protein (TIGR02271 family)
MRQIADCEWPRWNPPAAKPLAPDKIGASMTDQQAGEVLPLLEEELRIEKRSVTTGKVRVRSVVDTVEEVARASLEGERVEVTRVPVDREVDAAPGVRTEGDVTIVPVVEEILVVEKRLVLKEELHIRRHVTHENVEVPVTLRKQRAVIERLTADGQSISDDKESNR